jgi:2,3-bisphosphoglycerate-independent phosphoglycerate mutase
MGRYYGMDREGNWQLTQMAYDALTKEELELTSDLGAAIRENSEKNKTEELLPPLRLKQESAIKDGDSLFFFNFREDSIRQIAESFIEKNFNRFPVKSFSNLFIATITRYKETFDIPIAFPPEKIDHPLAAVISESGKIQLRVAETYKYAHVTYFFNAFKEEPYGNEYRVLVPSLQVASPAEHPQLSASAITDRLIQSIENQSFDFVLVNYANGDTIGHTGNYQAAVETVKVLDAELGRVIKSIESAPADTILCITSDHGSF